MLDFPKKSIKQAGEVIKKYRDRARDRLGIAGKIYEGTFVEIGYGFSESIKSGNCGRFLHEIKKECDCFTKAGIIYLLAREAGLEPQLYEADGLKDLEEGENLDDKGSNSHAFVVAKLGKNQQLIIDPDMGAFGTVKFDKEKHLIEIYDKSEKETIQRHYSTLRHLSEGEYLTKVQQHRSPEGGRKVLTATQRVIGAEKRKVFLTYLPPDKIRSSIRVDLITLIPEPYTRVSVTDLTTIVSENGIYDFKDGRLDFYYVKVAGWVAHEFSQVPISLNVRDAEKLWSIFDNLVKSAGRKSPVSRMSYHKLEDMILRSGFDNDFTVKKGSKAEQVIRNRDLVNSLRQVQEIQQRVVEETFKKVKGDEITYKEYLLRAQYRKISDAKKSEKDPYGLVFGEKEKLEFLEQAFEDYRTALLRFHEVMIEEARVLARLKKGSNYKAHKATNRSKTVELNNTSYFGKMCATRKSSFKQLFSIVTDRALFYKQYDLEKNSVEELENGLTEQDIKRAIQQRLFQRWIDCFKDRPALFVESYKKGLQRILNKKLKISQEIRPFQGADELR